MKAHAGLLSWHEGTWQIRHGSSPFTLPFDGIFAASSNDDALSSSTQPSLMQQIPPRWPGVAHRHVHTVPHLLRQAGLVRHSSQPL